MASIKIGESLSEGGGGGSPSGGAKTWERRASKKGRGHSDTEEGEMQFVDEVNMKNTNKKKGEWKESVECMRMREGAGKEASVRGQRRKVEERNV